MFSLNISPLETIVLVFHGLSDLSLRCFRSWVRNSLNPIRLTVLTISGADGAIHMCEEVIHARTVVPNALIVSITVNGMLGFGMLIGVLFCTGSISDALNSPTGFTFIEVFTQALESDGYATGLTALLLVLFVFCAVAVLAATSRVTWAFARDNGLPGSSWIKRVRCGIVTLHETTY